VSGPPVFGEVVPCRTREDVLRRVRVNAARREDGDEPLDRPERMIVCDVCYGAGYVDRQTADRSPS
jgi:hypothetical protein